MYRCYGNFDIYIIKSEIGGEITTHFKNTFNTAFLSRHMLMNIV